jgi:glycosyltransferase involved in cell wall biosynthesis
MGETGAGRRALRVLMLCENAPSTDPAGGDGSTMITAHFLRDLPAGLEVDLVYFTDGRTAPDAAAVQRASSVHELPTRSRRRALLAQPFTRLPRASWQRPVRRRRLRAWARHADVLYVHGLHVMHHALRLPLPVVVHEVDPWSEYWAQRAAGRRGPRRWYDLLQSRRAARLERAVAAAGGTLVVVSERDAESLRRSTGGRVYAVSNGVDRSVPADVTVPAAPVAAFVGTLDYPPNVEAVTRLASQVWPLVRSEVPDARLLVAGRHATADVRALARDGQDGVDVLGEVDDVSAVFGQARVSVYAGTTGRGTKNSVTESLVAGCPVVASEESARGQVRGPHLLVGEDPAALAALVVSQLRDDEANRGARRSCAQVRTQVKGWEETARELADLLHAAAASDRGTA